MRHGATSSGQQGFALIAALFLIVVFAGLGLYAARIADSQQQAANLSLLNSRALAAAESGLEYGAYQALVGIGNCASQPAGTSTTLNLNQGGLRGFTVVVTCSSYTYHIAPNYDAYLLTSSATYGAFGSAHYVARQLTRWVNNAP